MKVAVLRETAAGERRVALVPPVVAELVGEGLEVVVQAGAGTAAGIPDAEWTDAGARVVPDAAAAVADADVLVFVQPPRTPDGGLDPAALAKGRILLGFLDPLGAAEDARTLAGAGVSAFAMELVPRSTRAQRMDALSSQATVAGYRAVLLAAAALPRFLPMLTTAAGTIRPARALVLGAGVAGLQAIATARRLGARVEAFDVRPAAREQVESLGATFLETDHDLAAEGEGGYAAELSEEQHRRELELIAEHIRDADLVITTAQIPGREAPVLITEAMVASMKPGSVIVDLAARSGGNCELSEADRTVERHGVTILGPGNLPADLPFHASQMYAKNVSAFLKDMLDEGTVRVDLENDVVGPACLVHAGEVRNDRVRGILGLPELAPAPPPAAPADPDSDDPHATAGETDG